MRFITWIFILLINTASAQFNAAGFRDVKSIECIDEDGDEVYFTITAGNTGGYFQILPVSGMLQVDTMAYTSFIRQRTWYITVGCTDPQKNTGRSKYKIVLKKPDIIEITPVE